jgi:ATP-dependent Clp protease ATP-binding subunit ClpC
LGEERLDFVSDTQKDWFDWAESYLADWKARSSEWHNSFSPSAQQVLELATQAALSLNHHAIGAEHLLAAMLKLNSGSAAALKRAGLSLPTLREEIEAARGAGAQGKVNWPIGYSPRCSGIIGRAQTRVRGSGARVEIEDLLLELLAEKDGLPAQIFRRRMIDVEQIKRAVTMKPHAQ